MRKRMNLFMRFSCLLMLVFATSSIQAQDRLYADEFPLGDVTLLDGPLKKARDLNIRVLMQYDNDRLLAPYLKEAGLTPKGKSYPNWDGLDGHVGGHYLTALALNAATGSKECQERLDYWISELQACADANAKNHPEWQEPSRMGQRLCGWCTRQRPRLVCFQERRLRTLFRCLGTIL